MPRRSSNSVKVRYALSKAKVEKILSAYLDRLQTKYDLRLAILFGSYAKGSYSFGSDIDVLIVASDLPKDLNKRFSALLDLELPIQIQTFGYTIEEFTKMLEEEHPLITEVLSKGKVLYATSDYRNLIETHHAKVR